MVEKKSRFTFVNNVDTALTAKAEPLEEILPKKRIRLERASSNS